MENHLLSRFKTISCFNSTLRIISNFFIRILSLKTIKRLLSLFCARNVFKVAILIKNFHKKNLEDKTTFEYLKATAKELNRLERGYTLTMLIDELKLKEERAFLQRKKNNVNPFRSGT